MKQLILTIAFLIPVFLLNAQQTPRFETTLYFEDAEGNQDSLEIGFDLNATEEPDEEFGDIVLNTPFDSIFDVRAKSPNSLSGTLYKRMIEKSTGGFATPENCIKGGGGMIFIHAIHQPVKVSWNKTQFLDSICYRGAFIINHIEHELAGPMSPNDIPPLYYCMADVEEGYFELTPEVLNHEHARLIIEHEVEGQGVQEIYGLDMIALHYQGYTPCYWVTEVADISYESEIFIYPNPCSDYIVFKELEAKNFDEVWLYDTNGRHLQTFPFEVNEPVNISALPAGMYHLFVTTLSKNNTGYLGKVVKK